MSNFLSRFYLFSKLTTSLVLFLIIILLGYLFIKAYLDQNNITNNINLEKIEFHISELSTLVERNSSNINIVKKLVINNEQSVKNIENVINKSNENNSSNDLIVQLENLSDENQSLKNELNSLSSKIDDLNLSSQLIKQDKQSLLPIHNFIKLIDLKLDNGTTYVEEVKLLQDLPLSLNQFSNVEKLSILANKDFLGLNKLHNDFNSISSEYLNNYYLKKKNNRLMKYFLSFVTIQPNMSESTKDKNIKSLVLAKQRLLNNDLEYRNIEDDKDEEVDK